MNIKLYSLIRYLQKPRGIKEIEDELNVSCLTKMVDIKWRIEYVHRF